MSLLQRLFGGQDREAAPLPYAPDSPEGLAARWVRWAASSSRLSNPISDTSGKHAAVHQPDDVWFLAGTFGGTAHRRCAVPSGVPIFFPVINMWEWPATGPASQLSHPVAALVVDGVPAELVEINTPVPFEVAGAAGNPITRSRKPIPTAVWGLWRKLEALPEGSHTIRFEGGDGHRFKVAVAYEILVS